MFSNVDRMEALCLMRSLHSVACTSYFSREIFDLTPTHTVGSTGKKTGNSEVSTVGCAWLEYAVLHRRQGVLLA